MNKEITIYELLGLIKDNKAPYKIKYCGVEYCLNGDYENQDEESLLLIVFDKYSDIFALNETIEILDEENDEFEDIEELSIIKNNDNSFSLQGDNYNYTMRKIDEKLVDKINQLIRNQKKIMERLNKENG